MENEAEFTGAGRWMSFLGGGLLILFAVPFIFSQGQQASAGWSIFLGLLLIGSVASNNKNAGKIAVGTAAVLILRVVLVPVLGGGPFDFFYALIPLVPVAWAAAELRSQTPSP